MEHVHVTDEWLYQYMPIVDEAIIQELEKGIGYEYEFSDKFQRRMKKQIRREARPRISIFVRQSKKAAIFTVCAIGLLFLLSMSVQAYRIKLFETVKTTWEDSILYRYFTDIEDIEMEAEEFHINEPQYMPQGYKEIERTVTDHQLSVMYENSLGEMITWDQVMVTDGGTLVVDSEYDSQIAKEINGKAVIISLYSDGYAGVYYESDEYAYLLTADNLSIEEICCIVESIEKD